MNALYNIDLNIGVALMIVMLILFAVGTLVYALGWLLVETIRKRKIEWQPDWQPDCTVTETGVGVVESAERASELEAWAELVNIFDFGGLPDGKNDKS